MEYRSLNLRIRGLHLMPRGAQEGEKSVVSTFFQRPYMGSWSVGGSCGIKAVSTDGVGRGRESDQGSARVYGVIDDLRSVAQGRVVVVVVVVAGVLGVAQESGTRSRRKLKGRFLALLRSLSIPEL